MREKNYYSFDKISCKKLFCVWNHNPGMIIIYKHYFFFLYSIHVRDFQLKQGLKKMKEIRLLYSLLY